MQFEPFDPVAEDLDKQIYDLTKKLAEHRKNTTGVAVQDYVFHNWSGEEVPLSGLFGDKDRLIAVHNMGKSCPYCTIWADGFNPVFRHIEKHSAFAVVSPDPPDVQREFAESRGWLFPMASAAENSFFKDMGFADEKGSPWPGVSVFSKTADGQILRHAKGFFGPGDRFCSVFNFLDMLPGYDGSGV